MEIWYEVTLPMQAWIFFGAAITYIIIFTGEERNHQAILQGMWIPSTSGHEAQINHLHTQEPSR